MRTSCEFRADKPKHYLAPAKVEVTEPTGPDTLIMVHINGKEVVCRVHPSHAKRHGQTMDLMFDMSKTVFFDPQTSCAWP